MADVMFILIAFVVLVAVAALGLVLLLAFTTGFKKSGRIMGGLFMVIAPPGEGKTYFLVWTALQAMRAGRTVWSNFPIKSVDGRYVSRFWKKEYIFENISRDMVIDDELYREYFSRNFKEFDEKHALAFSTLGQKEVSFYGAAQHQDSDDVHINRVTNLWITIRKTEVPFLCVPLYFDVTIYSSLDDYKNAAYHPDIEPYDSFRLWFDRDVAEAYNTKYFAQDERPHTEGEDWDTYYARQIPPIYWTPPEVISLRRRIIRKFNVYLIPINKLVKWLKRQNIRSLTISKLVYLYWKIITWEYLTERGKKTDMLIMKHCGKLVNVLTAIEMWIYDK